MLSELELKKMQSELIDLKARSKMVRQQFEDEVAKLKELIPEGIPKITAENFNSLVMPIITELKMKMLAQIDAIEAKQTKLETKLSSDMQALKDKVQSC